MTYRHSILMATLLLAMSTCACRAASPAGETRAVRDERLARLFEKDTVTIVVTDSGLGGLSVMAAIERMLQQYHVFREVRLVFANALPDREHLYNRMETLEEKARVFDSALVGMTRMFKPDVILIACNTLSIVFPETVFSRSSQVPVIGIVDFGVEPIAKALQNDSTATAIILGTPTTIGQNTHAARLAALGFDSTRVCTQACDMLESEIQADPSSDIVRSMIEMYAGEALGKQADGPRGDLLVALCCSHYGFARSTFEDVYQSLSSGRVTIVDPNIGMGEYLFPSEVRGRCKESKMDVSVVSRAEIMPEEIASIANVLRPVSHSTADAVTNYVQDIGLFSY